MLTKARLDIDQSEDNENLKAIRRAGDCILRCAKLFGASFEADNDNLILLRS